MIEALKFWLAKFLAESAIGLCAILGVALIALLIHIPTFLRQRRCTHSLANEDHSCTAWCADCGKNLGFIDTWREEQRKKVRQ